MRRRLWARFISFCLLSILGCTGPDGATGVQGPPGDPGLTGDDGTPGGRGPQGEDGVDGVDGTNGVDGQDGQDGDPGRSYHLTGAGLGMTIQSATVDADGVATIRFRIADGDDVPLDLEGLYTEGPVSVRFVLGWLDQDEDGAARQYTSYVTRDQTSPDTGVTESQAAADSGGIFTEVGAGEGVYDYVFAAPVEVTNAALTHTVGGWATRDFDGERWVANALYNFRPDGDEVTVTREVVQTATCNGCHGRLEAHGGARRETGMCILCHSPQTVDPDTGNTVDFAVMVHKIHRGEDLPSVVAGGDYRIVGFQQTVADYSTVAFPQEIQRCQVCHTTDRWNEHPSRAACGSCHDSTSFVDPPPAGMTLHAGGTQADDAVCTVCHRPVGGLEGIGDVHLSPTFDPASPHLAFTIEDVTNTAPGQTPELLFSVTVDGVTRDIIADPLTRLALTVAGPTTDYATFWSHTIQGTGATGTLVADGASFRYTFPAPIPVDAAGSYSVGLEGYLQPGGGTNPRFSAPNVVTTIAVTDLAPVPRRQVVEVERCNSCHFDVSAHGGQRNDPRYCVMCHTPGNANDDRVSRVEGETVVAQPTHFKFMIHRIHMGEELSADQWLLGGFPAPNAANPLGTPIDFGELRYPNDPRRCATCHIEGTWRLPLPTDLLPTLSQELTCSEDPAADADAYCNTRDVTATISTGPEAAACLSCHDSPAAAAHAEINTTGAGAESCAVCHGPGAVQDVDAVHGVGP